MYALSVEKIISTAHRLRDYDGPCERIHGHNWKIRMDVRAASLDEIGIAVDFVVLQDILDEVAGPFDHQLLNDIPPFDALNPTAENLVKYLYDKIKVLLPKGIDLKKVTVWETDNCLVSYEE
jgi:6-pyruvoyltetrahydropterin/6-carboxytetrahydropterin synthase